jgi:hypothetical protein
MAHHRSVQIIVDAGNGSGGFFAASVLEPLGADVEGSQFLEPDGTFPNHIPNPEDKGAMKSAIEAVKRSGMPPLCTRAGFGSILHPCAARSRHWVRHPLLLPRAAVAGGWETKLKP